MGSFGNLEAVVLGESRVFEVAGGLVQRVLKLFVVDITDALEEQQREDVALEVSLVDGAAKDVRRAPEMGFELVELDLPRASPGASELLLRRKARGRRDVSGQSGAPCPLKARVPARSNRS